MPSSRSKHINRLYGTTDYAMPAKPSMKPSERTEPEAGASLRAGLHALAALDATALVASLDRLDVVKTGRPKKAR